MPIVFTRSRARITISNYEKNVKCENSRESRKYREQCGDSPCRVWEEREREEEREKFTELPRETQRGKFLVNTILLKR